MKQLVILSGKGGTGKTSVAAAFAHLAAEGDDPFRTILVDADVDASNLELVLSPTVLETHEFMGGGLAVIDSVKPMGLKDVDLGSIEIDIPADQSGPFQGVVRALDGPLLIEQGRIDLQPDGRFVVDGLVAAKPDAPQEIVQGLQFLGQEDSRGFRRFSQQGSL